MVPEEYTRESWLQAYRELIQTAGRIGLPEEIAKVIAQNLHSERCIRRMSAYIRNARPTTMEEIADEMVALMETRDAWIRKKQAEEANAAYTMWLNSDERNSDE